MAKLKQVVTPTKPLPQPLDVSRMRRIKGGNSDSTDTIGIVDIVVD